MARDHRFYVPELDGLRFIAFLMVFTHHAISGVDAGWPGAVVRAGQFGVDVFFVLSSYLITELLVREHERSGVIHLGAFYARRCLRIWPLYFVFLFAMTAIHVIHHHPEMLPIAGWFAVFAGNWECALHGFPLSAISPLWTVSIEEQFYVFWPLVLAWLGPKRMAAAVVTMLVVATVARAVVAHLGLPRPAMWCITFTRLDPIALGIALVYVSRRTTHAILNPPVRIALMACGGLILLLVARFGSIDVGYGCLLSYPLVAIGALLLVAALVAPAAGPVRLSWLARSPLVFLGRISYGLYVLHPLALAVALHFLRRAQANGWKAEYVAGLGLDIAAAVASYFLLERPFLRLKSRFTFVESRPGG